MACKFCGYVAFDPNSLKAAYILPERSTYREGNVSDILNGFKNKFPEPQSGWLTANGNYWSLNNGEPWLLN